MKKERIIIEMVDSGFESMGFNVIQGDRYSECLGYEEMLGLVSALTIPASCMCLRWMKTKEDHERWRESIKANAEKVNGEMAALNLPKPPLQ